MERAEVQGGVAAHGQTYYVNPSEAESIHHVNRVLDAATEGVRIWIQWHI